MVARNLPAGSITVIIVIMLSLDGVHPIRINGYLHGVLCVLIGFVAQIIDNVKVVLLINVVCLLKFQHENKKTVIPD